jgi:hydrogenase expression/formation protein HypE
MAAAAREAGVPIVTGDTKVVEKGKGDGVFISTTGMGIAPPGLCIDGRSAKVGDAILVSGTLGEHGVAVMSLRESLEFETAIDLRHRRAAHAGAKHVAVPAQPQ